MNLVHERIMKKPVFVIKFGPPASGKSTIVSKCFPLLTHKSIGINDYVERNTGFVQNSLRLARQTPGFSEKLAAGNANLAKKGIDVYMTYRKLYSKQHNQDLHNTVLMKQNVSFETTGISGFPDWLWDKYPGIHQYQVVLLFPIVPAAVAYKRYIQRAKTMVKNGQGFRFGSTYTQFLQMYIQIYLNFLDDFKAFTKRHKNVKVFLVDETQERVCKQPTQAGIQRLYMEMFHANQQLRIQSP